MCFHTAGGIQKRTMHYENWLKESYMPTIERYDLIRSTSENQKLKIRVNDKQRHRKIPHNFKSE